MISRYFHTLRYLKPIQIRYRIRYILRRYVGKITGFAYPVERHFKQCNDLILCPSIESRPAWTPGSNRFRFLNLEHTFGSDIDWSYPHHGKLWAYNLIYFEYLLQPGISAEQGLRIMRDFTEKLPQNPTAFEPYPISLRLIFWIRFFTLHQIRDKALDRSLYAQAYALADQLEYHLMGNHLIENGFGLLFAAYRYQDKRLYRIASDILTAQLEEQILEDGGHFERSPMYHQIIFYRLLDCLNITTHNKCFPDELSPRLSRNALKMLHWLRNMTFSTGQIALMNDSAFGVAPETIELEKYADRLMAPSEPRTKLGKSGYRAWRRGAFELIADLGDIGPDYIPGHAHSDTLSFELYVDHRPLIVDTGISTYEKNKRRQYERSTAAHNTVQIGSFEQSEVWGGFRVARRAKANISVDESGILEATHNGYDRHGFRHSRRFEYEEKKITLTDQIDGNATGTAWFHFHPDIKLLQIDRGWQSDLATVSFEGALSVVPETYLYAPEFNRLIPATRLAVTFRNKLKTIIYQALAH